MGKIRLYQEWIAGKEFDAGSFVRIHEGQSESGDPVVLKFIPKMPGAGRELLFQDLTGTPNILPILDTGEWEDSWVLVMPRAEKSLRDHLIERGGVLPATEAVEVLQDITRALINLEGDVVHRDLKPENVLLYEGQWHLADFGISRYAEATTAPDTLKYAKTWEYAAPEQWQG